MACRQPARTEANSIFMKKSPLLVDLTETCCTATAQVRTASTSQALGSLRFVCGATIEQQWCRFSLAKTLLPAKFDGGYLAE
jgi:hypothetical protein